MFNSHLFHHGARTILFCLATVLILGSSFATPTCNAQVTGGQIVPGQTTGGRGSIPAPRYYNTFFQFFDGEYRRALRDWDSGGFRIGQERFLDSVCYMTMRGECHYHLGNYTAALDEYEAAIRVLIGYSNNQWQNRVKDVALQESTSAIQQAKVTWHPSNRNRIATVPDGYTTQFGRLDAARVLVEGGRLANAEFRQVDVAEIMRCASLAIYRRHRILGPIAKHSPLTTDLIAALKKATRVNTAPGQWNRILIGLAHASSGSLTNAKGSLTRGLTHVGLDHTLTPIALLGLAHVSYGEGRIAEAKNLALEASVSAAIFRQPDMIEESIALATTLHLRENKSEFPPLQGVLQWAVREDTKLLHASALRQLAECFTEAGNTAAARRAIGQARRPMARSDLGAGVVGKRLRYLNAVTSFLEGNEEQGERDLGPALGGFAEAGSFWTFQLGLTNRLISSGAIAERQAEQLYRDLLRDPTEEDWLTEPLECMTFLTTPHVGLMERWFEILIARKNYDSAIDVSELVRRHRFYAALPLGGRLHAFRWLAGAPTNVMSPETIEQRKKFLAANPDFEKLAANSQSKIQQLKTLPLKPDSESDEAKQQKDLFLDLFKTSKAQEAYLRTLALRRFPADLVFPTSAGFSDLKAKMNSDQIALVSLKTGTNYHQFALNQQNRRYLGAVRERDIRKGVASVLKGIGVTDANNPIDVKTIEDTDWKKAAGDLRNKILPDITDDQWSQFREMVVVPDGLLWYLPFEILQTGDEDSFANLGDQIRMRYSPTINLAYESIRPGKELRRTAAVVAKFHPKGDPETAVKTFEDFQVDVPGAAMFQGRVTFPTNLIGAVSDQLISWVDTPTSRNAGPLSLLPFQLDRTKKGKPLEGSSLGGWLTLPFEGPESVVLPGYSSGGAAGVRKSGGEDLFLSTTALLASGVRTIMISRWRVGGPNSLELARQYAAGCKTQSASDAFAAATTAARAAELDLDAEPRVKSVALATPLKADHPFFWSGNMLIEVPDDRPAAAVGGVDPLNPDPLNELEELTAEEKMPADEDGGKADDSDDGKSGEANPEPETETETDPPAGEEPANEGSGTKEGGEPAKEESGGSGGSGRR